MKLLFSNIGRRTYFIEYCKKLKSIFNDLEVHVTDCSNDTAGFWVDKDVKRYITPFVSEDPEYYVEELFQICSQQKIDILIPLMDYELQVLSLNKKRFEKVGTTIIVADPEFISSTLDKEKFYHYCVKNDILTPKTCFSGKELDFSFPLILKKKLGSGSVGLKIIQSQDELAVFNPEDEVLQEFIMGDEYGIDILNDLDGNFSHAVIKKKIEMRAGETDKALVLYDELLFKYAVNISKITKHVGNLDLDILLTENNNIYAIDFNPRFGGGYPFSHYAGYNFLEAIIKFKRKIQVSFIADKNQKVQAYKGIKVYGDK